MIEAYIHGAAVGLVKNMDKLVGWATGFFAKRKAVQQERLDNLFWDARAFPIITGRSTSGISGIPQVPVREYGLQLAQPDGSVKVSTWLVLDVSSVSNLDDSLLRLFDSVATYLEGPYGHVYNDITVTLFKNGVLSAKKRRELLRLINLVVADTAPDVRVRIGVMDYVELRIAAWSTLERVRQVRRQAKARGSAVGLPPAS